MSKIEEQSKELQAQQLVQTQHETETERLRPDSIDRVR